MKRKLIFYLTFLLMFNSLFFFSYAEGNIELQKVTKIDPYRLVLHFSAPIEFNKWGKSNPPYFGIRVTDDKMNLQKTDGVYCQWSGIVQFIGPKHDEILFTITDSRLGIDTIDDILNRCGQLSDIPSFNVYFCIEEKTLSSAGNSDGMIDNITEIGGYNKLIANKKSSYDGIYVPIVSDSVTIDENSLEPLFFERTDAEVYIDGTLSTETASSDADHTAAEESSGEATDNSFVLPTIAIIFVAAAIIALAIALSRRDRK